ncbi:MAG: hypothetical protein ACI4EV_06540 [Lachnospiraceae bacterium]
MKHNRTKILFMVLMLTIIIVSISFGFHYRVVHNAGNLEMCGIDISVLALGSGMLPEIILPLIISLTMCYVLQYSRDYQHLIRSGARVKLLHKTFGKIIIMCAAGCLLTQLVSVIAGLGITGRLCNWSLDNSMFADEVRMTGLQITQIPDWLPILLKSFALAFFNCLYRSIAGICIATFFDMGWISIIVVFLIKLAMPHRIYNDFTIQYQPCDGNYYGELIYNNTYFKLLLCNIICVLIVVIISLFAERRKDYLK